MPVPRRERLSIPRAPSAVFTLSAAAPAGISNGEPLATSSRSSESLRERLRNSSPLVAVLASLRSAFKVADQRQPDSVPCTMLPR